MYELKDKEGKMTLLMWVYPLLLLGIAIGVVGVGIGLLVRKRSRRGKKGKESKGTAMFQEKDAKTRSKERRQEREATKELNKINRKQKSKEKKGKEGVSNSKNSGVIKVANSGSSAGYNVCSETLKQKFIQTMNEYNSDPKNTEPERSASVVLTYGGENQTKKDSLIGPDSVIMNEMLPHILSEEVKNVQYPVTLEVHRNGKDTILTFETKEDAFAIYNDLYPLPSRNAETTKEQVR